jgi:hypothetical protein
MNEPDGQIGVSWSQLLWVVAIVEVAVIMLFGRGSLT